MSLLQPTPFLQWPKRSCGGLTISDQFYLVTQKHQTTRIVQDYKLFSSLSETKMRSHTTLEVCSSTVHAHTYMWNNHIEDRHYSRIGIELLLWKVLWLQDIIMLTSLLWLIFREILLIWWQLYAYYIGDSSAIVMFLTQVGHCGGPLLRHCQLSWHGKAELSAGVNSFSGSWSVARWNREHFASTAQRSNWLVGASLYTALLM